MERPLVIGRERIRRPEPPVMDKGKGPTTPDDLAKAHPHRYGPIIDLTSTSSSSLEYNPTSLFYTIGSLRNVLASLEYTPAFLDILLIQFRLLPLFE